MLANDHPILNEEPVGKANILERTAIQPLAIKCALNENCNPVVRIHLIDALDTLAYKAVAA